VKPRRKKSRRRLSATERARIALERNAAQIDATTRGTPGSKPDGWRLK